MKTPHPHLTATKNEPVAYMTGGDVVEFETAESFLTIPREDRPNYRPLYTAPQPKFTPEQLQSVLEALEIGRSAQYINDSEFYSGHISENSNKIRAAIALLKGMK